MYRCVEVVDLFEDVVIREEEEEEDGKRAFFFRSSRLGLLVNPFYSGTILSEQGTYLLL